MSKFWSTIVHDLTPYVPGEQPKLNDLVKLNTNECPYGPSPLALAAMAQATTDDLRRYPDPNADALKNAVANYYGLQPNQIFAGNGSDEILAHTFHALLKHDEPILFADITYSFYPVYCQLYGVEFRTVPLADDFSIRVEDYSSAKGQQGNGGIIVANPNAPTGKLLPLSDIKQLLINNTHSVVVIDEAYIDFGGQSAASLVNEFDNLLVIQTLSKSRALAGLRVGFAMGHPALIDALERVKNSFNSYPLGRVAIAGAVASIEDKAHFVSLCDKVINTREHLVNKLTALGFAVIPSAANFVLAQHSKLGAVEIAQQLRKKSIIVRHFNLPRISNHLRISVGTNEETEQLLSALDHIINPR